MGSYSEDYVTLMPTEDPRKFLVIVMRYRKHNDEYWQERCSQPLTIIPAESLAQAWAAALHLEVR